PPPPAPPPFPTRRSSDLPAGAGELRRGFAGPLAAATMARALGVPEADTAALLAAYDAIVAAVDDISAGRPHDDRAYAGLDALLRSEEHTSELQSRSDLVC